MIDSSPLSEEDKQWLATVNFHYLLGYARNLRELKRNDLTIVPQTVGVLRNLIETETNFVSFLTPWLRSAEWHLRSLTVSHFCSAQGHGGGYLDNSGWSSFTVGDREKLQNKMLDSIKRHGEPYVTNHLKGAASRLDVRLPKSYDPSEKNLWLQLVEGLPLWAVVDSFSIGTLGKFIMLCNEQPGCNECEEVTLVWKRIAKDLGISANRFSVTVDAFGVLRNSAFHHQRLWMRPMSKSPGLAKELERRYKDQGFKDRNKQAQFISIVMMSKFLPSYQRNDFLNLLDDFLDQNELFKLGIVTSPFA